MSKVLSTLNIINTKKGGNEIFRANHKPAHEPQVHIGLLPTNCGPTRMKVHRLDVERNENEKDNLRGRGFLTTKKTQRFILKLINNFYKLSFL